jgi:hypothetical protein
MSACPLGLEGDAAALFWAILQATRSLASASMAEHPSSGARIEHGEHDPPRSSGAGKTFDQPSCAGE